MRLVENTKIVLGGIGLANAGVTTGDYVSMKGYNHLTIIACIAPASGTDTAAITLKQASDVAGTGEKALAFSTVHKNAATGTSDALVSTAVTANSVTTSALAASEMFVMEVNASQLDVANGFDCVRADVTDPGSVSTPICVLYILSEPRYAGATPPTAITD